MTNPTDHHQSPEAHRLKKTMNSTLWVALIFAALLPTFYIVWFWGINNLPPSSQDPSSWGVFGDFVGGILNPLVAFLALFWLTRSISIQREELRDTKIALEQANAAQQLQAATLEKQRFEDTFFALVDQHNKVLDQLSVKRSLADPRSDIDTIHRNSLAQTVQGLAQASQLFKQHDDLSGHNFRILYQILKLIATRAPGSTLGPTFTAISITTSAPSPDEKLYSNIIRSFLSTRVTQLVAVNSYCADRSSTYWNYKCLVERYSILEHMPFVIDGTIHPALRESVAHYNRSAFGRSEFLVHVEK